jgi:hypothetical protein
LIDSCSASMSGGRTGGAPPRCASAPPTSLDRLACASFSGRFDFRYICGCRRRSPTAPARPAVIRPSAICPYARSADVPCAAAGVPVDLDDPAASSSPPPSPAVDTRRPDPTSTAATSRAPSTCAGTRRRRSRSRRGTRSPTRTSGRRSSGSRRRCRSGYHSGSGFDDPRRLARAVELDRHRRDLLRVHLLAAVRDPDTLGEPGVRRRPAPSRRRGSLVPVRDQRSRTARRPPRARHAPPWSRCPERRRPRGVRGREAHEVVADPAHQ